VRYQPGDKRRDINQEIRGGISIRREEARYQSGEKRRDNNQERRGEISIRR
jgi:hypothetical protein